MYHYWLETDQKIIRLLHVFNIIAKLKEDIYNLFTSAHELSKSSSVFITHY